MLRSKNQFADALAILASMLKISEETDLRRINVKSRDEQTYCHIVEAESDGNPWFHDIKMFLKDGNYPNSAYIGQENTKKIGLPILLKWCNFVQKIA